MDLSRTTHKRAALGRKIEKETCPTVGDRSRKGGVGPHLDQGLLGLLFQELILFAEGSRPRQELQKRSDITRVQLCKAIRNFQLH